MPQGAISLRAGSRQKQTLQAVCEHALKHQDREQNAVFCSRRIPQVNPFYSQYFPAAGEVPLMSGTLFDGKGLRKYLVASERQAFVVSALNRDELEAAFCLTLAASGARISEVLALKPERVDAGNGAIVIETLKRRKRGVYRAIPVPDSLIALLVHLPSTEGRLWPWCRTFAWGLVKGVMIEAGIARTLCKPRALHCGTLSPSKPGSKACPSILFNDGLDMRALKLLPFTQAR